MFKTGVVAFGFDTPDTAYPNRVLAETTYDTAGSACTPVFAQRDVPIEPSKWVGPITTCPQKSSKPPSTWQVAVRAARWAQELGLKVLVVVAAAPHLRRAFRDTVKACKELGLRVRVTSIMQTDPRNPMWFRKDATQWHTKSWRRWKMREKVLCALPWFVYKLIADPPLMFN